MWGGQSSGSTRGAVIAGAVAVAVASVLVLALVAPGPARSAGATATATPRCLGAASRAPGHPCVNHALDRRVSPTPAQALLIPDSPCRPVPPPTPTALLRDCAFGPPAAPERPTVVLLGDSHAAHWRAALEPVAAAEHWHGESITRPSCQFAVLTTPAADAQARDCRAWNREVLAWFAAHPEVHTVFVSAFAGSGADPLPGLTHLETKVREVTAAWAALPASVRHIVVLRDIPGEPARTHPCVERAIARHQAAGTVCALPRRRALIADPLLLAARRLHSSRVRAVELTPFFCGPQRCYPVVGGVLTNKDDGHMTRAFARTLGPYLLRAVRRVLPG